MESEIISPDMPLKRTEDDIDAEFDQHNVDVEEILARTQRSFSSRGRRQASLYEAPEFVKRLNAFEEVVAGDTVVFECQWKALPKPTIKWYKDDQEITEDARYNTELDEPGSGIVRLVVNGVKKSDEGAYKCKAENQEGVASTTGYLSVSGSANNEDKTLAAQRKKEKRERKAKQRLEEEQQRQQQQQQEQQHDENGDNDEEDADKTIRKVQSDSKVSYPPHLRTIIEQKSLEEREAESVRNQPPSPIQEFIEKMQSGRGRGATWPYSAMGYQDGRLDDDAQSQSSDTSVESQIDFDHVSFTASAEDDDDVFTSSDPDDIPPSAPATEQQQQVNGYAQHVEQPDQYLNEQDVRRDVQQRNAQQQQQQRKQPQQMKKDGGHTSKDASITSVVRPIVCSRPLCVPEIKVSSTKTIELSAPPPSHISRGNSPKRKSTEQRLTNGSPQAGHVTKAQEFWHLTDVLDSPWIYFLPITSSMTFVASATEMSPLFLVLIMAVVSMVAFYVLFGADSKQNKYNTKKQL